MSLVDRKTLVERSTLIKHGPNGANARKVEARQGRDALEKAGQQRYALLTACRHESKCALRYTFSKNQQSTKEICDAVAAGQGVSVFTLPKLKRLMEDENLRALVCSRLNFGLDRKHSSEEEFLDDVVSFQSRLAFHADDTSGFVLDDQSCGLQRRLESSPSPDSRIGTLLYYGGRYRFGIVPTSFRNRSYALLGQGDRSSHTELWNTVFGKSSYIEL